jgi:hypothetical protein
MTKIVFSKNDYSIIQEKFEAVRSLLLQDKLNYILEKVRRFNSNVYPSGKFLFWSWDEGEKLPEPKSALELDDWWKKNRHIYYKTKSTNNMWDSFSVEIEYLHSKKLNIINNFLDIVSNGILPEYYEFEADSFNSIMSFLD